MSDEWEFYPLRVDDEPASIFLDVGIARLAPLKDYNTMSYLRVRMLRPREDGLSSQSEFEQLIALEDAVVAKIATQSPTIYVGRNTSHGNRDFYFYTTDDELFKAAAKSAMAASPRYSFETGGRPDPEWKTYFKFLYPSPASWQLIGNRHVLESLEKNGDELDAPRQIDHLAIFTSGAGCEAFAQFVSALGFEIGDGSPRSENGELRLEFSRVDQPRSIDDVSITLFRAALEHGGEYDGWGCQVVSHESTPSSPAAP